MDSQHALNAKTGKWGDASPVKEIIAQISGLVKTLDYSSLTHNILLSIISSYKMENEGFNTQKRNGYYLEHLFSKNYQGIKNHYYLIQIGHMISQIMESWEQLWKGINLSIEQKHQRIKDSFKAVRLKEYSGTEKKMQIRLQSQ